MEEDIISYLIENSTFIKNNMMNKIDDKLNVMMIVFIILNEDDLIKKRKNCSLLKRYVNDNKTEEKINNEEDFLNIISTINMFIRRVYGSNLEIGRVIEKINSYKNYLIVDQKVKQLRIS